VGKTRLSMDLMDRARDRGFVTLAGHCYEGEGARPWSPWIEILDAAMRIASKDVLRDLLGDGAPEIAKLHPALRRVYPDLPPPLDLPPEAERGYLFDCFCDFVARASALQPLLFVLEDLHWADEPTLLLLRRLCHRMAELPLLVIGTYRDVELDVDRPLAEALRELVRERLVERIALRRLPAEGVAELIEALAGRRPPGELVAAIHAETEGNPFFVEEVYAHLDEEGRLFDREGRWRGDLGLEELDVPEGVRLVLGRRLERLDEDGRRVLTAGAVIGRRFSYPLLEAVVGADSGDVLERIEAAERLHLVEADASSSSREPRYRFAHELIRQTLLQSLSMPRRQRLHLRVAEALERTYGARIDEEHAAAMAHHLYQAGAGADEGKTVRFLTLAGEQALTAGAFEDAAQRFDEAIELLDEREKGTRAAILVKRARANNSVGRTRETRSDLREAGTLYESVGDLAAAADAYGAFAMQAIWRSDYGDEALAMIDRGLAAAGEAPSPARCRLLASSGTLRFGLRQVARGNERLEQAIVLAESLGDDRLLGEILSLRCICHWGSMTAGKWVEDGRRAEALLRQVDDPWNWLNVAATWKVGLATAGRLAEAVQDLDSYRATADKLGNTMAQAAVGVARGIAELQRTGDIGGFRSFADWYLDFNRRIDYPWECVALGHLGLCDFWQGEWERSLVSFASGVRIDIERPAILYGWGNYYLALCHLDTARAEELFQSQRHLFPTTVEDTGGGGWTSLLRGIEGHAVRGQRERAAELYPLALGAIATGTVTDFLSLSMPQFAAAIAAACGERWEVAEEHYRAGLRQADEVPHRLMQPELRRWYARMLLERGAAGDRERARALLGEAIAAYEALGMPRHVAMARDQAAAAR
jgi:tetratricopeptide (TPR) repeat protein